jgi:hypothetical protein
MPRARRPRGLRPGTCAPCFSFLESFPGWLKAARGFAACGFRHPHQPATA